MTDDDNTQHTTIVAQTQELPPGDSLPDITGFNVKGIRGEGGMAKVYLAEDPGLDRMVAIKMISADLSSDPDFRIRFQNEAKIVAQFRHPNIVRVFAGGEIEDRQYIVMELVDGANLKERLITGALDEAVAVDIARQMADALSYSHARSIIHRDFKPANVLFTEDDTPVLTDFGVAKSALPEEDPLTRVGFVIGSLPYMSPEQSRAEPISDRIDIYAFGRVLYEMLLGELPPRDLEDEEAEKKIRSDLVNFSPELATLICKCLRRDPVERPSADECRSRLDIISQSLRPGKKPAETWTLSKPKVIAGAAVLMALAFILALLGKPPFPAENPLRSLLSRTDATPPGLIAHYFDVTPPWATLYIEGVEIDGRADLGSGEHSVVVVEPNHYGRIVDFAVDADMGETVIELDRITLPTQDELGRFISAIEAPQVMPGDLQRVTEQTLRRTLDIKRLSDSGAQDDLARLENQLDLLRSYEDPSSIVTLYLAAESEYLGRDSTGLLPGLQGAMNSGYALATFWYAIRLRDALTSDVVALDDPALAQYCETMQLASDQGLTDIAGRYLESECGVNQ